MGATGILPVPAGEPGDPLRQSQCKRILDQGFPAREYPIAKLLLIQNQRWNEY
jgi:hypothetical protein